MHPHLYPTIPLSLLSCIHYSCWTNIVSLNSIYRTLIAAFRAHTIKLLSLIGFSSLNKCAFGCMCIWRMQTPFNLNWVTNKSLSRSFSSLVCAKKRPDPTHAHPNWYWIHQLHRPCRRRGRRRCRRWCRWCRCPPAPATSLCVCTCLLSVNILLLTRYVQRQFIQTFTSGQFRQSPSPRSATVSDPFIMYIQTMAIQLWTGIASSDGWDKDRDFGGSRRTAAMGPKCELNKQ